MIDSNFEHPPPKKKKNLLILASIDAAEGTEKVFQPAWRESLNACWIVHKDHLMSDKFKFEWA